MRRKMKMCGQPQPTIHGEVTGATCCLPAGHQSAHEFRSEYMRVTWEPPGAAIATVEPPAPKRNANAEPEPRKPPARRRGRRRRSSRGWPLGRRQRYSPLREVLTPVVVLLLAGLAIHGGGLLLNDHPSMHHVQHVVQSVQEATR